MASFVGGFSFVNAQEKSGLIGSWRLYQIDGYPITGNAETLTFSDSTFEQRTSEIGRLTIVERGNYVVRGNRLILKTKSVTGYEDVRHFDDRLMSFEIKAKKLILVEQFDPIYTGEGMIKYETYYYKKAKRLVIE
jgi:hypothetical protein